MKNKTTHPRQTAGAFCLTIEKGKPRKGASRNMMYCRSKDSLHSTFVCVVNVVLDGGSAQCIHQSLDLGAVLVAGTDGNDVGIGGGGIAGGILHGQGISDLQAIADTLHSSVSTGVDVRFASLAGQGLDPKFIGAASVAPEGKICGPVAGTIGTYIFKVNSRDTGSFYTEDDARNAATQMNNYTTQMILPVMMMESDVRDHRARFY